MSEQQQDQDDTTKGDRQGSDGATEPGGITDEQLPEDLQPTEDNPLGRHPGQTGDEDDKIGADTEGGGAENPSTNLTYGSGPDDGFRGEPDDDEDTDAVKAEEDDGSASLEHGGGGAG